MSISRSSENLKSASPAASAGSCAAHAAGRSAAQASNTRTIVVLRKNNTESIHVRVTDVGGTSLIDLRVFSPDPRRAGEPVPTRNGICIPRRQLRTLIDALRVADREGAQ
ncbi:MAG: PC4/YdbC family ssDNA-binding protein [Methylobacterium radiotolerans]